MKNSSTIMRKSLKRIALFIGLVCGGGYGKEANVASKELNVVVVGGCWWRVVSDSCPPTDNRQPTTRNEQPTTSNSPHCQTIRARLTFARADCFQRMADRRGRAGARRTNHHSAQGWPPGRTRRVQTRAFPVSAVPDSLSSAARVRR